MTSARSPTAPTPSASTPSETCRATGHLEHRVNEVDAAETVRQAADAPRRLRFGVRIQEQYAELRSDPAARADYLSEAETTHVHDGIS